MTKRARTPAWWEQPIFTDGPETEWFARSVFQKACQAGKTVHWRCTPTRCSAEELDQRLRDAGYRLVLEHDDRPRARSNGEGQLRRVYVRTAGDGVVIVNRDGAGVSLSVASFEPSLIARLLTSEKAIKRASRTGRRADLPRS